MKFCKDKRNSNIEKHNITSAVIMAGVVLMFIVAFASIVFFNIKTSQVGATENATYNIYSKHYVMITDKEEADFWDTVYEGAVEEGKKHDSYVERLGENLSVDYSINDLLRIAINASVDGIIVPGSEDPETVKLINQAVDQGIFVVTVRKDSTTSKRQCFVGINSYNIGQEYGKQILDLLPKNTTNQGDGNQGTDSYQISDQGTDDYQISSDRPKKVYVLVDSSISDSSQNIIVLAIRETLTDTLLDNMNLDVEAIPVDNTNTFSSEESIRDIFLDTENLPDIMICLNTVYTQCVDQAVVDYNKVGDIDIIGYYDSDATLTAVSKEIIHSTIVVDAQQMGSLCVQAFKEYDETGYANAYLPVNTKVINKTAALRILNKRAELKTE